jgi:hypothetical protein
MFKELRFFQVQALAMIGKLSVIVFDQMGFRSPPHTERAQISPAAAGLSVAAAYILSPLRAHFGAFYPKSPNREGFESRQAIDLPNSCFCRRTNSVLSG